MSPLHRRAERLNPAEMYLVDVGFATATVLVDKGKVSDAEPVFCWMIGRQWETIKKWNKIISIRNFHTV